MAERKFSYLCRSGLSAILVSERTRLNFSKMKIAVAGKGGVGKTTVSALFCWALQEVGKEVLAVDADPDPNLAYLLGFPDAEEIVPIVEMKKLIQERMELNPSAPGWFKMNPKVDDIPERFLKVRDGIKLIVMGKVKQGAGGCVCPESAFLKRLLQEIVLRRKECIVVDFEAGLEHLGRGTAQGFDYLIVVVEPSQLSLESFLRIDRLAKEIGVRKVLALANKVQNQEEEDFIRRHLNQELLGILPFTPACIQASLRGDWQLLKEDVVYFKFKSMLSNLL
jgi:CO dehydrogenase maturation factor